MALNSLHTESQFHMLNFIPIHWETKNLLCRANILELNKAQGPKIQYCHINENVHVYKLPLQGGMLESRVPSQRAKSGGGGIHHCWLYFQNNRNSGSRHTAGVWYLTVKQNIFSSPYTADRNGKKWQFNDVTGTLGFLIFCTEFQWNGKNTPLTKK